MNWARGHKILEVLTREVTGRQIPCSRYSPRQGLLVRRHTLVDSVLKKLLACLEGRKAHPCAILSCREALPA
jgi:hypothetical protein